VIESSIVMVALALRCQDLCTPAERVGSQAIGAEPQKSLFLQSGVVI
jgi:hypothetical protein